jgi:4-amino-4-deoxy-L-arabinose transferase-like glycosyltransferase
MKTVQSKKQSPFIFVLIIIALLLRVAILLIASHFPAHTIQADSPDYINYANAYLQNHAYPLTAFRTYGYPLFLAGIFSIFGQSEVAVVLVQLILNSATIFLTYLCGRKLFPSINPAMGAALLLAFSLESVISTFFVMTETLFTFLLVCSVFGLILSDKNRLWLLFSGIMAALAILVRPVAVWFPLLALLLIILAKEPWHRRVADGMLYLLGVALLLLPWMMRNQLVLGQFTLTTRTSSNKTYFQVAPMLAEMNNTTIADEQNKLQDEVSSELQQNGWERNEVNISKAETVVAEGYILKYPARFIVFNLKGDLKNFLPGFGNVFDVFGIQQDRGDALNAIRSQGLSQAVAGYFGNNLWVLYLLLPFTLLLVFTFLAALAGTVSLIRRKQWKRFILLAMPALYLLVASGGISNSRFRVPVMPFVCLLAGLGISEWISSAKKKKGIS